MPAPRFLLFSGAALADSPARSRAGQPSSTDSRVHHPAGGSAWRLLSRNNRELGRSPAAFATVGECVTAIESLRGVAPTATRLLSADDRDGRWCWRLMADGLAVAVSSRSYHRQRECVYSLGQFLVAVAEAETPLLTQELPARPRSIAPAGPAGARRDDRSRPVVGPGRLTVDTPVRGRPSVAARPPLRPLPRSAPIMPSVRGVVPVTRSLTPPAVAS